MFGVIEQMIENDYPRKNVLEYMRKFWELADMDHEKFKKTSIDFFVPRG